MLAWNLNLQVRFRFKFSSRPAGILFPLKVVLLVLIILIIISSRLVGPFTFYTGIISWLWETQKVPGAFICKKWQRASSAQAPLDTLESPPLRSTLLWVGQQLYPLRVQCWRNSSKKAACILFATLGLGTNTCVPFSSATSSKSWVLTKLCVLNMLPSSTCIWFPSKSSSSSAIGWWPFHCFILRLCCWWQASRNLSWCWSCSPLIHGFANLKVIVWQ